MLQEVGVKSLGFDRRNKQPVVILEEKEGDRVLPIWIGPGEASAIAMKLADMPFERPLTHDLFSTLVGGLGGSLEKVIISKVENDTFYAELLLKHEGGLLTVDARPSDSIAIALRLDAPIFAHESLLERINVEVTDDPGVFEVEGPSGPREAEAMNPEELQDHLRKLNPQDFGRFTP